MLRCGLDPLFLNRSSFRIFHSAVLQNKAVSHVLHTVLSNNDTVLKIPHHGWLPQMPYPLRSIHSSVFLIRTVHQMFRNMLSYSYCFSSLFPAHTLHKFFYFRTVFSRSRSTVFFFFHTGADIYDIGLKNGNPPFHIIFLQPSCQDKGNLLFV